jgi:hypothetical protein
VLKKALEMAEKDFAGADKTSKSQTLPGSGARTALTHVSHSSVMCAVCIAKRALLSSICCNLGHALEEIQVCVHALACVVQHACDIIRATTRPARRPRCSIGARTSSSPTARAR